MLLTAFVACCANARAAELTFGSVLGRVQDSHGAPVASAEVEVHAPSGRYQTVTDSSGHFVILGIVPDTYEVDVLAKGFEGGGRS